MMQFLSPVIQANIGTSRSHKDFRERDTAKQWGQQDENCS
jgi:hypothetical protein